MSVTLQPIDDPAAYNAVVAAMPISSPLQSWGFGEARAVLGHRPARFLIRRNGSTVGALQLLRKRPLPGIGMLYAPRGPAVEDLSVLPELAAPLRSLARVGDVMCKIEPPQPVPAAGTEVRTPEEALADQRDVPDRIGPWVRGETEQPEHTLLVDLTRDSDDLFAGLHKMARRNVRTAERMGVTAGRDDDFESFWEIFTATNERAKLGAFPRAYYETLLRAGNAHGSQAYLVLSRHEGRALAGGFFLGIGDTTAYLYGGSIRDDRPPAEGQERRKDVKAADAFYWNAILDAREHGFRTFDFWGIPRVLDESKHSFGVFRMKLKFSTDRYWFPAYDLRLGPVAPVYTAVRRARRMVRNYRTRGTTDDIL